VKQGGQRPGSRRTFQALRDVLGRPGARGPIRSVVAAAVSSSAEISGPLPSGGAPYPKIVSAMRLICRDRTPAPKLEGIHYRYLHGQTVGSGFEDIGVSTEPLLDIGLGALRDYGWRTSPAQARSRSAGERHSFLNWSS
jgi:hypothetical protein